ncbi:MAG: hypothetical protein AAGA48_32280 [Myxococcota bacterium]
MWWWLVLACNNEEPVAERVNAEEQDLIVLVRQACTDDESATLSLPLLSNVGRIEIGVAEVTPGCASVGDTYVLDVELFDEFEEVVDETQIIALPEAVSDLDGDGMIEARDAATYLLVRDEFDPGVFSIMLQALGAATEERDDRWRVELLAFPEEPEDEGGGGLLGG